jgi:hypothetical protein
MITLGLRLLHFRFRLFLSFLELLAGGGLTDNSLG